MEHRTSAELKGLADVIHPQKLSKKELLERWALALEQRKGARLRTLKRDRIQTSEGTVGSATRELPADRSLRGPGAAVGWSHERYIRRSPRFFGLSHWQLHEVVCNCHFGETVASEAVAARVRRLSGRSFATFAYGYAIAAALLAGTVLLSRVI